jgi:hypothetical protein
MGTPKDIWHFARPLLAKQYLAEFDLGLISANSRAPPPYFDVVQTPYHYNFRCGRISRNSTIQ